MRAEALILSDNEKAAGIFPVAFLCLCCLELQSAAEYSLVKIKNAKANIRETCNTKLLSGMKRTYSLHCPQFHKTGNSPEFSMHGGPVCGQVDRRSRWIVDCNMLEQRKV